MKNVIFLIIDSFSYQALEACSYRPDCTPFLNSLKENGLYATNVFSQAPFTEAALSGLICGSNPLDNGTYLFGYKNAKQTVFELFRENGYETYNGNLYPSMNTSYLHRGIDFFYYAQEYYFDDFYKYRVKHYRELYKQDNMSKEDFDLLGFLLIENISSWINVLKDFDIGFSLPYFTKEAIQPYNFEENIEKLETQLEKLLENPEQYIINLFHKQSTHPLFDIPPIYYKKLSYETKRKIKTDYNKVLENIFDLNKRLNRRNNRVNVLKTYKKYSGTKVKGERQFWNFLKYQKDAILNYPILLQMGGEYDTYKRSFSAKKHFDNFLQWQSETRNPKKPFFASMHLSDIHVPPVCFSYDEDDKTVVDKEFEQVKLYAKKLPHSFKGNLNYYLALLTLDNKIKAFYEELKEQGLMENTYFVVTADHGSSYLNDPVRHVRVDSCFSEYYKVPFIVTGGGITKTNPQNLFYTKDIPHTLAKLCGISPKKWGSTTEITEDNGRAYLLVEYLGEGCADILHKNIQFVCFDKNYKVYYEVNVLQNFVEGTLLAVYNLQNDPKETQNLRFAEYDRIYVENLLNKIQTRFAQLQQTYQSEKHPLNTY